MTQRFEGDVNNDIQHAIQDASDWSRGVPNALNKLRDDIYFAKKNWGEDSAEYKMFAKGVVNGLSPSVADEVALAWGLTNVRKFDTSGDSRLNFGELEQGIRTSADPIDRAMLGSLKDHYEDIKHNGGSFPFGHKDSICQNDLRSSLEKHQHEREEAARLAMEQAAREQAEARSRDFMAPLVETKDGMPSRSLFKVIDDLPGGHRDNEVSRKDLRRYLDEYDRRERQGDLGGNYVPEKRAYVQMLNDNWDSQDVMRLRGSHTQFDRSQSEVVPNSAISLESLQAAGGMKHADLFGRFIAPQDVQQPAQDQDVRVDAHTSVADVQRQQNEDAAVEPKGADDTQPKSDQSQENSKTKAQPVTENIAAAKEATKVASATATDADDAFIPPGMTREQFKQSMADSTNAQPKEVVASATALPANDAQDAKVEPQTMPQPVKAEPVQEQAPPAQPAAEQVQPKAVAAPSPLTRIDGDIDRTVQDSSDLTYGGNVAANRLRDHVYYAQQNYGAQTRDYNYYSNGVAHNLPDAPLSDISVAWAKRNIDRFDISNDHRLNRGEIEMAIRTTSDPLEKEMLRNVRAQYEEIKRDGGTFPWHKDSISAHDMQAHLDKMQQMRHDAELARIAQEQLERERCASRDLMRPLLETRDGLPSHSLFKIIDDLPGGHRDNKINRRDLNRYLDEYDRRERQGDLGGNYNPYTRQYVQELSSGWDSPQVVRLRGTYQTVERGNQPGRTIANSCITLESLNTAAGWYKSSSPYSYFVRQETTDELEH